MLSTRQRILRATAEVLSWQPQGADGEPSDPGAVTVGVTDSDGTTIVAAGTAASGTADGPRTIALTQAQTSALDVLTATWKVGATTVAVTQYDIVGGVYFTSAELRDAEPSLGDQTKYPLSAIVQTRSQLEAMVESVCGVAFVPRFDVATVSPACELVMPWAAIRSVRWMRSVGGGSADVDVTLSTALPASSAGIIDVSGVAFDACRNVQVGYEHGYDTPPADLKRALMIAARVTLNAAKSGVPDRATMLQLADGGTVTLATPGVGRWRTGIPTVDEVINRYCVTGPAIG